LVKIFLTGALQEQRNEDQSNEKYSILITNLTFANQHFDQFRRISFHETFFFCFARLFSRLVAT